MFRVNQLIFEITNFKNNFQKLLVVLFQRNRLTPEGSNNLAFDLPNPKVLLETWTLNPVNNPKD